MYTYVLPSVHMWYSKTIFKDVYQTQSWTYLIYISQPLDDIIKCFLISYVVDKHYPHCAAVVRRGDSVEPLLSSRIPDLQLDFLTPQLHRFYFKVDAYKLSTN